MANQTEQPPAAAPAGEPANGARSPIVLTTRGQPDVPRDPYDAPVRRLTVNLISTYKGINKVYYDNKKRVKEREAQGVFNDGHDDEHYDYKIVAHERLNDRYEVSKKLGKGSFGQVVRCLDIQTNTKVAVKIIKSRRPFFRQAQTEISLLKHLNKFDEGGDWNIVRITDTFVHKNHQCIVFEMLSYNLYELLRNTSFRGVSLNLVRKFARQILKTLAFLALGCVDIIHCDLKPENILLRNHKHSAIKVIDFGSSCKSANRMYTYIQSRFYRSPEVMLGLPYTVAIDMWSLACILAEMHSGEPLFSGRDEYDQMQRIISMLGMPPVKILKGASKFSNFFERTVESDPTETKRAAGPGARGADCAPDNAAESSADGEEYQYPSAEAVEEVTDAEEEGEEGAAADAAGSAPGAGSGAGAGSKSGAAAGTKRDESAAGAAAEAADGGAAEGGAEGAGPDGERAPRTRKRRRMRRVTYRVLDKGPKYRLSKSRRSKTLASVIGMLTGGPHGRRRGESGHDEAHYRMFYSLLCGMLRYEAGKRTRPLDALRHPFFADTDSSYFDAALSALELATRHEMRAARRLLYRFRTTRALHDSLLEERRAAATAAADNNESALRVIDAMCPWPLTKISNTTLKHKDLGVLLSIERYRVLRRFMPAFAAEARRIGDFEDPDGGALDGKEVIIVPRGGESAAACPDGVPGSGAVDSGSGTSSVVVVAKPAGEAAEEPAPAPGVRTRPTHVAHDGYNKAQDSYNRVLSVFKWLKVTDPALKTCMHEARAARMLVYGKGTAK